MIKVGPPRLSPCKFFCPECMAMASNRWLANEFRLGRILKCLLVLRQGVLRQKSQGPGKPGQKWPNPMKQLGRILLPAKLPFTSLPTQSLLWLALVVGRNRTHRLQSKGARTQNNFPLAARPKDNARPFRIKAGYMPILPPRPSRRELERQGHRMPLPNTRPTGLVLGVVLPESALPLAVPLLEIIRPFPTRPLKAPLCLTEWLGQWTAFAFGL